MTNSCSLPIANPENHVFLQLDGEGATYQQLTRALKAAILDGSLGAGTRLPPTRALAQELGVSRITVLSAYDQLRAEGYLQSRVGSGSYVSELQITPPLRAPQADAIVTRSRYAQRARVHSDRTIGGRHRGLRFNLQYGEVSGNPSLNHVWVRELARAAAYTSLKRASPDDVLIVNGSQQAFALIARVLLDEGDPVVLEEPHYFAMWQAFAAHGASMG